MEEFKERGYEIVAYGFSRNNDNKNFPHGIDVHTIGSFSSASSYFSRLNVLIKGIRSVVKKHEKEDCVFYLFRNDIAIIYSFITRHPYVFEEADMTHLNISNKLLRNCLERKIKTIIKHSVVSVFRSEGFVKCHFGNNHPDNVFVIPNRLHPRVLQLPHSEKTNVNDNCLKFGFVGGVRYNTIFSFANALLKHFPQHQIHFFGFFVTDEVKEKFITLDTYPNCFFHGAFQSPEDLPDIYSQIDVLLSTYDVSTINPRYAEPNKLYEAIYFDTPIIVSSNSYLADKVSRLGIGYDVDATNEDAVVRLVKSINRESLMNKRMNISRIDKMTCINKNEEFFNFFEERI